jgi:single-stranded-DNA-specific exonuclease
MPSRLGKQMELNQSFPFEAVYCIDENEWNGKVSIQLRLKNIK